MANLPPVTVLGPEGPPPIKKPRTDSDSDVLSLLDNFNDELPEDLISADLRISDSALLNNTEPSNLINNSTPRQVTNTTPPQQQQQQNTPRPPLSSPQPPSSISTSGAPTPTMPCVSSTPTHNVAMSAGLNTRTPLQMASMSSGSTHNPQLSNHSNAHFTSSSYTSNMSGSPHHVAMGGPHVAAAQQQMQHNRVRPPGHGGGGGMTGPLTVGMNQPHPMAVHPGMPPPHHGAMDRNAMGMGRMIHHQGPHMGPGGIQMAGGPQYIHHQHPAGHHQGMHGMPRHHMVNPGMPNQQQMGGPQGVMGHMMPGAHGHMQSNMIHHGGQPHMVNMHGPNARFGNPNTIRSMPNPAGGAVMNNVMQDNPQLAGGNQVNGDPNLPPTNFFGGLQHSPQLGQPGGAGQGVGQRAAPPIPAGLSSTAFPSVPTSGSGEGAARQAYRKASMRQPHDPSNQPRTQPGMMGGGGGGGMGPGVVGHNPSPAGPSGSQHGGGMVSVNNMGPGFNMQNSNRGYGVGNNPMGPGGSRPMMPGTGYPNSSGMPPSMAQPTYPLPIPPIPSTPTQPWHDLVNPDMRQHLVRRLIGAIYPVHDPVALQDKRVYSLIQYAMKVEKAAFDIASNRDDYFKLLAQKIYHIRKELEDRKKIKKGNQVNGDPNLPPTNFFGGLQHSPQPGQPGGAGQGVGQRAAPPIPAGLSSTAFPSVPTSGSGEGAARQAYRKAIREKSTVNILTVRINYMGLPRSGKTSFRRRLVREISNILEARRKGQVKEQPSTGVAEEGEQIVIRNVCSKDICTIRSKVWSILRDLGEEANMISQFIYQVSRSDPSMETSALVDPPSGEQSALGEVAASERDVDEDEFFSILGDATEGDVWEEVKYLLEDIILLIKTDTGGQAEFLDLQASLVQGPSLNLLFSRLVDDLDSQFKIRYTNEEGVSTEERDSTMTVQEVLFQSLSSISCFSGCYPDDDMRVCNTPDKVPRQFKSKAMFVGTYRDKLESEQQFRAKDKILQQKVRNTDFFKKGIIEFASKDQMMLSVDNMSGGEEEMDGIRKTLERVIEKCFEKIPIPTAWLVLNLCIRKKNVSTMSLQDCESLAGKLNIGPDELQHALWFLHHCIGVLLYYPKVLKDTVICKVQVLFDSATNLIKNTFTFDWVDVNVAERFRETGQFSLQDVKTAISRCTDDLIPLEELVKLLNYLNILALMCPKKQTFFMPCVLSSARASDLSVPTNTATDPAPLLVRYDCGYVPAGVFPAMMANLISQQLEDWIMIEEGLRKNRVQFFVGDDYDTVSLISHPQYFEISVSRRQDFQVPNASLCGDIRNIIQSTMQEVTSHMNYDFHMGYKFGFECPIHADSGREHPCVLAKETASCMECHQNPKKLQVVPVQPRHRVWFLRKTAVCASSAAAHPGHSGSQVTIPSLKLLSKLTWTDERGHEKTFELQNQVSTRWVEFGIRLGLTLNQLEAWKVENQGNITVCWYKVMESWLAGAGGGEYPATWKGLCKLLGDLDLATVARNLNRATQSLTV